MPRRAGAWARRIAPLLRAAGAAGRGFAWLPADEALAGAVLEVSERPLVASNADFSGVGGLRSDVVAVFLEELAQGAGLNVHIRVLEGKDPQNVLSAIFKALGAAIGQACRTPEGGARMSKDVDPHRARARAVPGRAVQPGDRRQRLRLRRRPARRSTPRTGEPVEGGIGPQTERVFANLRAILEAAGSSLDAVVKTTVFLTNLDDFAGMNEVYARTIGETPPARSTVEVSRLPSGLIVEIEAIALA